MLANIKHRNNVKHTSDWGLISFLYSLINPQFLDRHVAVDNKPFIFPSPPTKSCPVINCLWTSSCLKGISQLVLSCVSSSSSWLKCAFKGSDNFSSTREERKERMTRLNILPRPLLNPRCPSLRLSYLCCLYTDFSHIWNWPST